MLPVAITPGARKRYDEIAARWSALIAWYSNDPEHHGIGHIEPQIERWQRADLGPAFTDAGLLDELLEELDAAELYAVDHGFIRGPRPGERPAVAEEAPPAGPPEISQMFTGHRLSEEASTRFGEELGKVLPSLPIGTPPKADVPLWAVVAVTGGVLALGAYGLFRIAKAAAPVALPLLIGGPAGAAIALQQLTGSGSPSVPPPPAGAQHSPMLAALATLLSAQPAQPGGWSTLARTVPR